MVTDMDIREAYDLIVLIDTDVVVLHFQDGSDRRFICPTGGRTYYDTQGFIPLLEGFGEYQVLDVELIRAHSGRDEAVLNIWVATPKDVFADCVDCVAWSGTDCTRHPYKEGCLKDGMDMRKQIIEEFSLMLIKDFVESADNQELSTVKGVLKNVCPAKVSKIKKRILRSIEK